jgi:hypothetical protein
MSEICSHCGVTVKQPCGRGFTKCVYYKGRTPAERRLPKEVACHGGDIVIGNGVAGQAMSHTFSWPESES